MKQDELLLHWTERERERKDHVKCQTSLAVNWVRLAPPMPSSACPSRRVRRSRECSSLFLSADMQIRERRGLETILKKGKRHGAKWRGRDFLLCLRPVHRKRIASRRAQSANPFRMRQIGKTRPYIIQILNIVCRLLIGIRLGSEKTKSHSRQR